ncbi:hypothetical protein FSS13T_19680 [Flavobacterium saliperosum S13]|uniref:Uncharacterized protein n=1 Tax=Flavobacterium saliperosum S13 TaxID=1341155 RepID=A0ABN0QFC4_9FLAO|nr:hypothetical protein FSS13T_19680 [Flavobacterium saliperosum S13]
MIIYISYSWFFIVAFFSLFPFPFSLFPFLTLKPPLSFCFEE